MFEGLFFNPTHKTVSTIACKHLKTEICSLKVTTTAGHSKFHGMNVRSSLCTSMLQ